MRVGERFRFGHRRREMQSLLCNLTVAHPSQKTRMMGVGMFVKWDEHMSYRRHRVPPLQRTQGRGTHSRIIGEETKTEGRATRRKREQMGVVVGIGSQNPRPVAENATRTGHPRELR